MTETSPVFLGNPFVTRDDVLSGCIALVEPLVKYASPGGAIIELGSTATHYDLGAVAFETFARPLWALASLVAGGDKYAAIDGWVKGLNSGTDPEGQEFWGEAKARDQRMVDMCPLSYAIALAPETFFYSQVQEVQNNITTFLNSCNAKLMPDSNWLWFRVFANLALAKVDSPLFDPQQMEKDLVRLEQFQLPPNEAIGSAARSSGWSRDGPDSCRQLDYYSSSFAIQTGQMIYSKLAAERDPERAERYRQRAREFVLDLIYYFDDEGAGIPFGRSMVYRFAIVATFASFAMADIQPPEPLKWGHIKGIVLRHLRSWAGNKDIFKSDGVLNIGYGYDNMNMTENYNAPAFLCLAAKSDHPFWTSDELPWPTESFPYVKAIPDAGHILCRAGGHTFCLSSGQHAGHYHLRHPGAKYSKFAYSSTFGFSCPTGDLDLEQLAGDSMIALRDVTSGTELADGENWRIRRLPENAQIIGRGTDQVHLHSFWRPWNDVEVQTWLFPPQSPSSNWYVRIHKIVSSGQRVLDSSEAGWTTFGQGEDGRALVQAWSGLRSPGGDEEVGWARANTRGGCVGILDLPVGGSSVMRQGELVQSDPNSNVIFSRSILPTLRGKLRGTTWLATAVFGLPSGPGLADWKRQWEQQPSLPSVTGLP